METEAFLLVWIIFLIILFFHEIDTRKWWLSFYKKDPQQLNFWGQPTFVDLRRQLLEINGDSIKNISLSLGYLSLVDFLKMRCLSSISQRIYCRFTTLWAGRLQIVKSKAAYAPYFLYFLGDNRNMSYLNIMVYDGHNPAIRGMSM